MEYKILAQKIRQILMAFRNDRLQETAFFSFSQLPPLTLYKGAHCPQIPLDKFVYNSIQQSWLNVWHTLSLSDVWILLSVFAWIQENPEENIKKETISIPKEFTVYVAQSYYGK